VGPLHTLSPRDVLLLHMLSPHYDIQVIILRRMKAHLMMMRPHHEREFSPTLKDSRISESSHFVRLLLAEKRLNWRYKASQHYVIYFTCY